MLQILLFDYDIVASTSNPVMIRSVRKGYRPVTYDIPKPFKKQFTEEDLYKADCQTFGSLIGPLTNDGTSIVALISHYEKLVKEYDREEDKKKLKLLQNRLKMVCAAQSRQIDKAKIGKNVKGVGTIFTTFNHINDTDAEEEKKEKEFYNSILCDRRPYFFKYLYKTTKKNYNDYFKRVDERCQFLYRMSYKELKRLDNKTEEQLQFVEQAEKNTKLINSDCEMNRLCRYIEDIDFDIKRKVRNSEDFDYHTLMDNNILFKQTIYYQVYEKMCEVQKQVSANNQSRNSKSQKTNVVFDYGDYNHYLLFWEAVQNLLLGNICSNMAELTNYLIYLFYVDKKSWSKTLLWKVCGEQIFQNCLASCNYQFNVPVKEKNGEIRFCNDYFTVTKMQMKENDNDKNI